MKRSYISSGITVPPLDIIQVEQLDGGVPMDKIVALEGDLSNIRRALEREGYQVLDLNPRNLNRASAVIVSGRDDNVMNMQDISTRAPVINAEGQSADEVLKTLKERLQIMG